MPDRKFIKLHNGSIIAVDSLCRLRVVEYEGKFIVEGIFSVGYPAVYLTSALLTREEAEAYMEKIFKVFTNSPYIELSKSM